MGADKLKTLSKCTTFVRRLIILITLFMVMSTMPHVVKELCLAGADIVLLSANTRPELAILKMSRDMDLNRFGKSFGLLASLKTVDEILEMAMPHDWQAIARQCGILT